jgi:hypothetical protein
MQNKVADASGLVPNQSQQHFHSLSAIQKAAMPYSTGHSVCLQQFRQMQVARRATDRLPTNTKNCLQGCRMAMCALGNAGERQQPAAALAYPGCSQIK